jgi:hypothetical protein
VTDIFNMTDNRPEAEVVSKGIEDRLTHEEDDELRRLNYLAKIGPLSERNRNRFIELRLRDRRHEIREPREFGVGDWRPPDEDADSWEPQDFFG